jgi:hypothetical protein
MALASILPSPMHGCSRRAEARCHHLTVNWSSGQGLARGALSEDATRCSLLPLSFSTAFDIDSGMERQNSPATSLRPSSSLASSPPPNASSEYSYTSSEPGNGQPVSNAFLNDKYNILNV